MKFVGTTRRIYFVFSNIALLPGVSVPPGPPSSLYLVDKSQTSVTLKWVEPSRNGGDDILGYFVDRCLADDDNWTRCNVLPFVNVQGVVRENSRRLSDRLKVM